VESGRIEQLWEYYDTAYANEMLRPRASR
jgi:hypothetical protein